MTRGKFRLILGAYFLVVLLSLGVGHLTEPTIPTQVRELEPIASGYTRPMMLALLALIVLFVGTGIVGLVGMFCLWSPSRIVFLAALLLRVVASPVATTWLVTTAWETVFCELEILLAGVVVTISLAGPAKHLFERRM